MFDEFIEGRLCVFLEKHDKRSIKEFYDLIAPYIKNIHPPRRLWSSIEEYLLDEESGPFHAIILDEQLLNGGGSSFADKLHIPRVHIYEFLKECSSIKLEDKDIDNIFGA